MNTENTYHSTDPSQQDVPLDEIEAFYTETRDKERVRDELLQLRCATNTLTPNIHAYLFTEENNFRNFPYLTASWIANTHKRITPDDIYPIPTENGDRVIIRVVAMVDLTEQDIKTQPCSKTKAELEECLIQYKALMKRDPNAFLVLGGVASTL